MKQTEYLFLWLQCSSENARLSFSSSYYTITLEFSLIFCLHIDRKLNACIWQKQVLVLRLQNLPSQMFVRFFSVLEKPNGVKMRSDVHECGIFYTFFSIIPRYNCLVITCNTTNTLVTSDCVPEMKCFFPFTYTVWGYRCLPSSIKVLPRKGYQMFVYCGSFQTLLGLAY